MTVRISYTKDYEIDDTDVTEAAIKALKKFQTDIMLATVDWTHIKHEDLTFFIKQ